MIFHPSKNGHRGHFGDAEVGQSGSNFIHSEGFKLFVEKWETPSDACEDVHDIPSRVKNLRNGGSRVSSITHNTTMPFDWVWNSLFVIYFSRFFVWKSPLEVMLSYGEENSSFNKLALHDGGLFVPQLRCSGRIQCLCVFVCCCDKVYDFNEQHQELHALRWFAERWPARWDLMKFQPLNWDRIQPLVEVIGELISS